MKIQRAIFSLSILIFCTVSAFAAKLDTVSVFSNSMQKDVKCVVVRPTTVKKSQELPVVYLLHGYGGSHKTYTSEGYCIKDLSDKYQVMIVAPDGKNSWYWDSPKNPKQRYETFVSKELRESIDSQYRTIKSPKGRAIAGFSMGGHGALFLAIRHQDIFGAAASMSGGVDIRPFPNNWDMKQSLGERDENLEIWDRHTVINQLDLLKDSKLKIFIDCGSEDFFLEVNEKLHDELTRRKFPHYYMTRPGKHNHPYWQLSLKYHIISFSEFFKQ